MTIEAGGVAAQSRSIFLPKNTGLGEMVHRQEAYWRGLFRPSADGHPAYTRLSVFGEWCGPGVQKGVRVLFFIVVSIVSFIFISS